MSGRTLAKPPIHDFVDAVFAEDLHAKRVLSLSDAALGVLTTASLAICTIGQGLAAATGGSSKCSVKQVDRLLSNPGIDIDALQAVWVPYAIGGARRSMSPWTGPNSMPTRNRRSCCR